MVIGKGCLMLPQNKNELVTNYLLFICLNVETDKFYMDLS
jgi:hypothetical protein